jgi:RND superfamily putative drug exporter
MSAPHSGSSPSSAQLGLLGRIGRGAAKHHRWVGVAWLLVILAAGYVNLTMNKTSDNFRIPHTDSQSAYDLLAQDFSSQNNATATVVFSVPDGQTLTSVTNAAIVNSVTQALSSVSGVTPVPNPLTSDLPTLLKQWSNQLPPAEAQAVLAIAPNLPPSISANQQVAFVNVTFDAPLPTLLETYKVEQGTEAMDYPNPYNSLVTAVSGVQTGDVTVSVGGVIADTYNNPVSWWANHSDEVGLGLGAILLLLAFGSVFGMAVPIATALFGAVTAGGLVFLMANYVTVSSAAPPVTLMIAIGVGLDYSLLIVTRYRAFVAEGRDPHDAAGLALASAGKAAVFAGLTVCIALLGLLLVPIPLVQTLGVAAAIGVGVMILAAITLLPCLLGFTGNKIDRFRLPFNKEKPGADPEKGFWGRFAHRMARRPWFSLIGGIFVLLFLAWPFLSINFGMPDDSSLAPHLSQRVAYEQVTDAFGPGVNGPLIVAVKLPAGAPYKQALQTLDPVSKALGAVSAPNTVNDVQYSFGPIPNNADNTTAVIYQIIPSSAPDSQQTKDLVATLRSSLETATKGTGLEAHVGGATATLIDLTELVTQYLPWVIGVVVFGSFILLMLVFRSILVPLKAALMNLISIAAAYGVVVAVFQWGWAREWVGLYSTIPIVSFVPLIMFVILFGLSMDYEVFLMSRIREEWDLTHEPRKSVVLGVANTGRVITTAALIMIAVFASFVTNANPTVKLIGFGMAVAVLLDSTIVRMVLVPAIMELFGKAAWWFPKWLEWLPKLNVEGPPELVASEAKSATDTSADTAAN